MKPEIISVGELIIDIIRPERDIGLRRPGIFEGPFPAGAPVNFIAAAAKMGAKTGYISVVGNDYFGKMDLARLKKEKIDTSQILINHQYTTGTAFISFNSDGSRRFVYHLTHSASGTLSEKNINEEYFEEVKLLHITGTPLAISDGLCQACYRAMEITLNRGGLISFDPNLIPELFQTEQRINKLCQPVLEKAKFIFPAESEVCLLTGLGDIDEACRFLAKKGKVVALKLGERGSKIFTKEGEKLIPSIEVEEINPTGAGDCFAAAFMVAFFEGKNLTECAIFGNIAGALAVTAMGPMEGIKSRKMVDDYFEKYMKKKN